MPGSKYMWQRVKFHCFFFQFKIVLDATREKMLKLSIFFEERGKSDFFYSRISMTSRENDLEDEGCYLFSSNRPETRDAFHSTQNSRNFGWYIKWNGPFLFGPTGILGTSFEGGPLWPVRSFGSVGPKCPFPFDKIVVPSTALLHPVYKNNNQTRGGLGRVCVTGMYSSTGHVKFPKFQTGIFVEWKALQTNQPREKGTSLFDWDNVSYRMSEFQLRFDQKFLFLSEGLVRLEARIFGELKVLVGTDRPEITTFGGGSLFPESFQLYRRVLFLFRPKFPEILA